MATKDELMKALRKADAAGNAEDAKRLAQMVSNYKEPRTERGRKISRPDDNEDKMGFLNKRLAETLGAPVDITNAVLSKIGLGSEKPFGGSESIRSGMEKIGAPTPERDPETMGEQIFSGVGEVAGSLLPAAGLARRYQGAQNIAGQMASGFNRELVERPARAVAAELAAGAGMGVGREVAEQKDLAPSGRALAEFTGALAPGAAVSTAFRGPTALAVKGASKLGEKAFVPFTTSGGEARAARRVQELSDDIPSAIRGVQKFTPEGLSPATATGQEGLLDLEDAILRRDPARAKRISKRSSESIENLKDEIIGEGSTSVAKPKAVMESRRRRALAALDARVEASADEAAAALDELGDVPAEQATEVVYGRLRAALDDAKVEENRLWSRIPERAKAPVRNTLQTYKKLKSGLSSAQSDDMPPSAAKVIGPRAKRQKGGAQLKKTTIRELDGLYKRLGEEATQARANREFNKARIAEDLRESILDDIAMADGGPEIQETIQTARAYSKELNEKFRKGATGKILGFAREGGPAIDPSLAMERTIGASGQTGEVARRQISKAVADDPTAMEGMQDYIKSRFLRNAVEDGAVNPTKARTFLKNNKEMLDAFPQLREQLVAARRTEDVRRRVTKRGDSFRKAIDKPAVATASRVLNAPAGEEFGRVMNRSNPDPVATIKAVKRTLNKDKTGEAMKGFKSSVGTWIMDSITPMAGGTMSGKRLQSMLKDQTTNKVLREVYSHDEMKRLKRISDVLERFQRQQSGGRKPIVALEDKPAWLLEKIARMGGAMVGSKVTRGSGYGSIQVPGIFSTAAKDILEKLTADKAHQILSDAIEDPKLFKALLEYRNVRKPTPAQQRYEKTLKAWMAGPGARLFEQQEEAE